jgi:O-antigen biosynthesis protein
MKNGRTKKISVLVPTRDHHKQLGSCLANLAVAESETPHAVEVIVLDGSPADDLAKLLESRKGLHDLSWCPVEQWWNFSQIINYGVKQATGEYLLLLNDDCYVSAGVLSAGVDTLDNNKKVGVCGFLLVSEDSRIQHGGYTITRNPLSDTSPVVSIGAGMPITWYNPPQDEIGVRAVSFACAMLKRELHERLEGLDPGFCFGLEDVDFCLRAAVLGLETRIRTDIRCIHEGGASVDLMAQNFPRASPLSNAGVLRTKWGHLSNIGM